MPCIKLLTTWYSCETKVRVVGSPYARGWTGSGLMSQPGEELERAGSVRQNLKMFSRLEDKLRALQPSLPKTTRI